IVHAPPRRSVPLGLAHNLLLSHHALLAFLSKFKGKRMRFVSFRPASSVIATVALLLVANAPSQAQTRAETLRYVTGASVNTLDPNIPGSTRESFALSMSTYDRLVAFGRKQLNGKWVFDLDKVPGGLAG